MPNARKPRQNDQSASRETNITPRQAKSGENPLPAAREAFNILLALEGARGLLSVRDVAALLGRSSWSVYRMAEKRQIPSLLIGGSRVFDPSVLALWLTKKEPTLAVAARRIKAA
jgi:predicted DNA-binding transcriptional regulator AlpA